VSHTLLLLLSQDGLARDGLEFRQPGRAGPANKKTVIGPGQAGPGRAGPGRAGSGWAGSGWAGPGNKKESHRARPGWARPENFESELIELIELIELYYW